jgi:hypothetical protein
MTAGPFDDAELLNRACLRAAMVIRGMWEEKGSSDTRLLEEPLIPDRLTLVGRSRALKPGERHHREHVVPRLVIIKECHRRLHDGALDSEIAAFIRDTVRIVLISGDECRRLDRRNELGLRQLMPSDWQPGGDLFARLHAAGIKWEPVGSAQVEATASRIGD